mgnify:FL=1
MDVTVTVSDSGYVALTEKATAEDTTPEGLIAFVVSRYEKEVLREKGDKSRAELTEAVERLSAEDQGKLLIELKSKKPVKP